jgi:hypothetical protein
MRKLGGGRRFPGLDQWVVRPRLQCARVAKRPFGREGPSRARYPGLDGNRKVIEAGLSLALRHPIAHFGHMLSFPRVHVRLDASLAVVKFQVMVALEHRTGRDQKVCRIGMLWVMRCQQAFDLHAERLIVIDDGRRNRYGPRDLHGHGQSWAGGGIGAGTAFAL